MERVLNFFHHFFIPSEKNNFRAKTLHIDVLSLYLFLAIIISVTFKFAPISGISNSILGIATDINESRLLDLTNKERALTSLPPLKLNEKLSKAARSKAADMFAKNYWAHYGPDGETPWDFIMGSGYKYEVAGENLAKNFMFSDGVVEAWMKSPTHKENLLKKDYTDIGFAIVNGKLNGEDTTLVVQMFGRPLEKELVQNTPNVISTSQKIQKPILNFKKLTFNYSFLLMGLLLLALIFDLYFAYKLNVVRITGKHLAHFIFLGFVVIGLLLITKGSIL